MIFEVTISPVSLGLEVLAEDLPDEILPAFVNELAGFCFNSLYQRAPWRTGFLAMSIAKSVQGNTAQVGPTAPYAKYVSFGTAPHEIYPINARCLAFESPLGGLVFAAHVHHPGTKANPYVQTAAEETVDNVLEIFSDIWQNYAGV